MGKVKNVLFIMADQLRADYLACYGNPTIRTPHIDALSKRGVLFTQAYCQGSTCGSSRASFYTGRYSSYHGAVTNKIPLRIDERLLGDYLGELGLRTAVVGKTHMPPNVADMQRLGIDPESARGKQLSQPGFEPYERDDGLHPDQIANPTLAYNQYLRRKGYEGENPWHSHANSADGKEGEVLSGWEMRHAGMPARVKEEDSETAYMTNRAMDFIHECGDEQPWCLHLSYIKPHWPYIVPAPYHQLYGVEDIKPTNRNIKERNNSHPLVEAFMQHDESLAFAEEQCVQTVIPTYMGLIQQIDDHIGRLMTFLEQQNRLDDTLIVFTSDHGDYLGDHWLGEKDLLHEESVRIPMIVCDPSAEADASRGTQSDAFVESIDLIPTFVDSLEGKVESHLLQGRSLKPLLHENQQQTNWRSAAICEMDYSLRPARAALGTSASNSNGVMIRTQDWKYIDYNGFSPQLFNMRDDPFEQVDLGVDPQYSAIRCELKDGLYQWQQANHNRTTLNDDTINSWVGGARRRGMQFGRW